MSEAPASAIDLLIVDDHAMFRDAIAEKLAKEPDMTVIGACGSTSEASAMLVSGARPSVLLLDFDLGGTERVVDFVQEVRAKDLAKQVLVVTAGVSGREAVQLIQAGVRGIIHKHNPPNLLCDAIRQVFRGEVFLEKAYLAPVFHGLDQTLTAGRPRLTERDKTILRLVFQGLLNKEIAGRLEISEGGVKSAISQLFHKLGVRTRAQLVKVALEQYGDQL